nr:DUF3656 domain-containing protein [Eubacterium sp.]
MINKKIEILAPCGSMEAFNAAVNAGTDACYLAGQRFGARAYADNFDVEELCRVIDKAHLKGVKVYMTVNTLFKNAEIKILTEYLRPIYEAGLDAFIIQDLGVFMILKEAFPEISLHASTQMNICSAEGAMMLKELGASRVIPARELSLEEIRDIKSKVDIEVETFVHGAMCYCYSGRCLLSSMIGDRSGNRGRCAQPCRKKYDDEYLLSMKDMCALKAVPGLIDAGVDSLKIEGRMKGEYYTAAVVNAYKEIAYDCINNHFSEKKCERLSRRLADIFNRGGFSTGYFYPENTDDMLDVETPGHKGVLVGKVRNAGQGKVIILCTDNISKKDVLLIKTNEGSIELTSDKDAKKGDRITLNAMKSGSILADSDIYRKINYSLMQEIREKILLNDKLMPVSLKCIIKSNEPLRLSLSNDDTTVQVEGGIVQPAKTAGISSDSIRDKIAAFGNTGYYPVEVSIENDGRSFVSFSELKSLRRELLAKLEEEILSRYRRKSDAGDNSDLPVTAKDIDHIKDNDLIEDINIKYIHFNLENMTEADRLLSVLEQYEKKTEYIVSFDVDSHNSFIVNESTSKLTIYSVFFS